MEIFEVRSKHDLTVHWQDTPRPGAHAYRLNCHQFMNVYRAGQRGSRPAPAPLGLMTLGFERIWMTEPELAQVSDAIQRRVSPLAIESRRTSGVGIPSRLRLNSRRGEELPDGL